MLTIKWLGLNLLHILHTLVSVLLSSKKCIICNVEACDDFCKDCAKELFFLPFEHRVKFPHEYCSCCSRPLICEKEVCISCKRELEEKEEKSPSVLLFPYTGRYVDIVLKWKKEDVRSLSLLFAKLIRQCIEKTPSLQGIPIVPVPARPRKLKTKGWDQIEDICSFLEAMRVAKIARILARKDGHTQKGLSKEEREKNVKGQFYIKKGVLKRLEKVNTSKNTDVIPKKLILLDDVVTTGSTIIACTEALRTLGCKEIINIALFFN